MDRMKSHNEFIEEVKEASREPTIAEKTHDGLRELNNTKKSLEEEDE